MSNIIFNFRLKRTFTQALIFYVIYTIVGFLFAYGVGKLAVSLNLTSNESSVVEMTAALYAIGLYFIIYTKKKLTSFLYLLVCIALGPISIRIGFALSMVFIAILTTMQDRSNIITEGIKIVNVNDSNSESDSTSNCSCGCGGSDDNHSCKDGNCSCKDTTKENDVN